MDPKDCLAIHEGETMVAGLRAKVTVVRDRWGVPHIKAANLEDAFFGQGFCIAQDRMWQLELIRSMALGRAAALLNKGLLALDIQNRKLGYGRLAEIEWAEQTPQARAVLQAYANGINAAIATQPVPFEFRTLGHTMQPWSPVDSLAIIKMVQNGAQWANKLKFGQVAAQLGPEAVEALMSDVPRGASVNVPSGVRWAGDTHPFSGDILRALASMGEPAGVAATDGGSNCWVIHGSRTVSGAPLVAGDPHLNVAVPGQWYVVHMECPEFIAAGPCNPGYPGPVFYGHNTKVAWAMTNAHGDRWDLYRERVRRGPESVQALFRGEWEPLELREEEFAIRVSESSFEHKVVNVWSTRHGPVVSGSPEEDDEVIAARWGLADPAHDIDAMVAVLRASTSAEARAGLRLYDSISGNYCFATTEGDIGYQYAGRIPRRKAWLVPMPGWDGAFEWQGDVPKEDLPAEDNPESGYFASANNKTTTPDYPHYLSYASSRFRADRIRELIDEQQAPFTAADMRRMQSDQISLPARELAPHFAVPYAATEGGRRLQALFRGWDGHLGPDSAVALAYDAVSEILADRTVRTYLKTAANPPKITALEERRLLYQQLLAGSPMMLGDYRNWPEAIGAALDAAYSALANRFGDNPTAWRWDAFHRIHWRHNLGREADLAGLLNMPVIPVGGDGTTIFCTTADEHGLVSAGVSFRQILDLSDLNAAQICIPPGNSGQPGSPHSRDNLERWLKVEYHPLYINWNDIEANAEATLRLTPA